MVQFISCLILIAHVGWTLAINTKNIGPFHIKITSATTCKGPKRDDCTTFSLSVDEHSKMTVDLVIKQNIKPTNGKIVIITDGKEFMSSRVKNPCDHSFMKPIIPHIWNITKDCEVLKGHYHYVLDIEEQMQIVNGGQFIYGDWMSKVLLYSNKCNFVCLTLNMSVMKKKQ